MNEKSEEKPKETEKPMKDSIFNSLTHYAYVYVPYKRKDLYHMDMNKNNVITLLDKIEIYDNPCISMNQVVKSFFHTEILPPVMPTVTQYIEWLNTVYIIDKQTFISP